MPDMLQIVIVYNTSNTFGLAKDAQILKEALPRISNKLNCSFSSIKIMDAREPPIPCDICIHLEVPYAVWFSWAKTNVMMVNTEWWLEDKWGSYWSSFDVAVYRPGLPIPSTNAHDTVRLPWSLLTTKLPSISTNRLNEFVWFLGGSPNKRAAAEAILPLWKSTYPRLSVYCLEPLSLNLPSDTNVSVYTGYLPLEKQKSIAANVKGHVCISKAESFGYTAAEAEELGVFTILNTLPCYKETYASDSSIGVTWVDTPVTTQGFADFSNTSSIQANLDSCIESFMSNIESMDEMSKTKQTISLNRQSIFLAQLTKIVKKCMNVLSESKNSVSMPPLLAINDCPPISIITLTYNRPKFIENACLNLLHSDYPRDKIEWIVLDDSDPTESASHRIVQFDEKFAPGKVVYIPLTRKRSIGYKRNLGVERASNSIILMMDDDDHYPTTSIRRRVAYLLKGSKPYECGVCTTIAMYDLQKGVSAVNVPPYTLSLAERCSEATLTFTKAFWQKKQFEDVSVAEGEEFLKGREDQVVEIPPQQIIIALSHTSNLSSRKMPDSKPGCFWGFSKQLLEFLHGLIGIKVEEDV